MQQGTIRYEGLGCQKDGEVLKGDFKMTPQGQIIQGYKATDKDMCCRGFQFEIGKWYEHDGDLLLCESGFHFCEYPSGPWSYYSDGRLFECEAEFVLLSSGPGSDLKHVAKKIRLVREINIDGHQNTGDQNTGYQNTGNLNTGDVNTGHRNTGNWNTGNWNTGYQNTGYQNTGNRNTGNRNTGNGNVGNNNSGDLCLGDAPYLLFNLPANRQDAPRELINKLSGLLMSNDPIDPSPFLSIPNATPERIKALHDAHIAVRAARS